MTNVTNVMILAASMFVEPGWVSACISVVLGAFGTIVLLRFRKALRGTTLIAAWYWAAAALLALIAVELIAATANAANATWAEPLRFAAAAATFCPIMSALGAKRPQDKAWQFIVLSLWIVLILPAAQLIVLHPDHPLQLHVLVSWFLVVMIAAGLINMLPTRHWPSALLFASGQIVLLIGVLPLPLGSLGTVGALCGIAMCVLAAAIASVRVTNRRPSDQPFDRVWLDFRDSFGALWGLRVAERINAAAHLYDWGIVLGWRGFRRTGDSTSTHEIPPEVVPALRKTLNGLLRRFVSSQWIASRLGDSID